MKKIFLSILISFTMISIGYCQDYKTQTVFTEFDNGRYHHIQRNVLHIAFDNPDFRVNDIVSSYTNKLSQGFDSIPFDTINSMVCEYWSDFHSMVLYRLSGPAIITTTKDSLWFNNGYLHRLGSPAVICNNGYKAYYRYGKLHREDGPAIIGLNGQNVWYYQGQLIDSIEYDSAYIEKRKYSQDSLDICDYYSVVAEKPIMYFIDTKTVTYTIHKENFVRDINTIYKNEKVYLRLYSQYSGNIMIYSLKKSEFSLYRSDDYGTVADRVIYSGELKKGFNEIVLENIVNYEKYNHTVFREGHDKLFAIKMNITFSLANCYFAYSLLDFNYIVENKSIIVNLNGAEYTKIRVFDNYNRFLPEGLPTDSIEIEMYANTPYTEVEYTLIHVDPYSYENQLRINLGNKIFQKGYYQYSYTIPYHIRMILGKHGIPIHLIISVLDKNRKLLDFRVHKIQIY